MTTNAGADRVSGKGTPLGFASTDLESGESAVIAELEKAFRPEFLNRIDGIAVFSRLTPESIGLIARKQIAELTERAAAAGVKLTVTDAAVKKLAELGYSEKYGARGLYRTVVKKIEDPLAEALLKDPGLREITFDETDVM